MGDKRRLKKAEARLERFATWKLAVLLILVGFISATFLRINNVGMVERRNAVINADKAGDEAAIRERLYSLQQYAATHMNADPGSVALTEQYKRDSMKAREAAVQNTSGLSDSNVNQKVAEVCDQRAKNEGWRSWGDPRYNTCTEEEFKKYPGAETLADSYDLPNPDLYYYRFVSPAWTPDFAGFSLLACFIILVMIVARLIGLVVLRILLKKHYKSV